MFASTRRTAGAEGAILISLSYPCRCSSAASSVVNSSSSVSPRVTVTSFCAASTFLFLIVMAKRRSSAPWAAIRGVKGATIVADRITKTMTSRQSVRNDTPVVLGKPHSARYAQWHKSVGKLLHSRGSADRVELNAIIPPRPGLSHPLILIENDGLNTWSLSAAAAETPEPLHRLIAEALLSRGMTSQTSSTSF